MMHFHGHGLGQGTERQDPEVVLKEAGIRKGMTVADLGCGSGFFALPVASMVGKEGVVYAVDRDQVALGWLRQSAESDEKVGGVIRIVHADVSKTNIPVRSVDVAFFANLLHDIEDKPAFLNEVKRILKRSGIVVVVDWQKVDMAFGPPFEIRLDERSAKQILLDGGFEVLRSLQAGPYHYGFVCRATDSR